MNSFMKKNNLIKISLYAAISLVSVAVLIFFLLFFSPNINVLGREKKHLFVLPNQSWEDVISSLDKMNALTSETSFKFAIKLKYSKHKPQSGKYDIEPNLSNRYLLNRISYGLEDKIILRVYSARNTQSVAANISKQLMIDSTQIISAFLDKELLKKYGLDSTNSLCLFIPTSKKVDWDIPMSSVLSMVEGAYKDFWNESRRKKAAKTGLTLAEIDILASIVEEETNDYEDKEMVAGVYLNRLRRGIPLQSCPTVRFAIGDFTLNRILKKHLSIDSPFNTYIHKGLPPAPIRIPTKESIDAVLNFKQHNYLYICAKPDFSGTHDYSRNYKEHSERAKVYQRKLDEKKIY